ncbi:MAG: glycosyltransferase [Actinomycetota bacterium]|nr:glycosyltransferase [Actinomycetota bacterium]
MSGPPRVLHVARDWVRPSEGFVADVVRASTRTTPTVAYGRSWPGSTPAVPATDLTALARRLTLSEGDRALRAALRLTVHRRRAALLHSHFGYWAHLVAAVARRTGRPWTVAVHGHDVLVEGDRHGVLPSAALVVVPSRFLGEGVVRLGVEPSRLRVVPSGLDLSTLPFRERSARPDGSVVVTFAGRYVAKKGVLDATAAFAAARQELPGLAFRFVGHGPQEADLSALLERLRLPAELVDGSRPGAVRAALAGTDLLVTASREAPDGDAETLGLVNLEAHACGVPLVSTATGGVPEAVCAEAATLVPEGDTAALAAALVQLARSPESWAARGRAGRAHVERHFDLRDRVAELEELWLDLLRTAAP